MGDAYAAYTASEEGASLEVFERGHVATERDATAIAYAHARNLNETFVYTNDLARMKSGFDLVTRAPDGSLVFSEIKGTRGAGGRALAARLATTRHKGRQLSHRWIWASLLEAGLFSASASLFLRCLRPVLAGAYRRRALAVSVAAGEVTALLDEEALGRVPTLAAALDLSAERAELEELDRLDNAVLREDGAEVLAQVNPQLSEQRALRRDPEHTQGTSRTFQAGLRRCEAGAESCAGADLLDPGRRHDASPPMAR